MIVQVQDDPVFQTVTQLIFVNPFATVQGSSTDKLTTSQPSFVPIYSISNTTTRESAQDIAPNTIIEKGIFPACIRGAHFHRRYLFRLTINTLSMTTNLSPSSVAQDYLSQSGDTETAISLIDIDDIVLTHFMDDRDDIFEIHLRGKTVISVGKKTDSDELQMETAQFYSSVRDQRETLINAIPPSSPLNPSPASEPLNPSSPPRLLNASPVPGTIGKLTSNAKQEIRIPLGQKKSHFPTITSRKRY